MSDIIYYVDQNNNYYVDYSNNNYVWSETMVGHKMTPYIYINGKYRLAKSFIVIHRNIGPIPQQALVSSSMEPILTKDRQYIITTNSSNTVDMGNDDYTFIEVLHHVPHILKPRNV